MQKLEAESIPYCDAMMSLFLQVFGAKNSTVHEEALMAVGTVANATEAGFEKYMMHFRPFLSLGLSNYEEHQVRGPLFAFRDCSPTSPPIFAMLSFWASFLARGCRFAQSLLVWWATYAVPSKGRSNLIAMR